MPKRIIFQFEDDLDYQIQAIHSTVELFRGLSRHVDGFTGRHEHANLVRVILSETMTLLLVADCWKICVRCQLANGLFADNVLAEGNNGLT